MTGIRHPPPLSKKAWEQFLEEDRRLLTEKEKSFLRECYELYQKSITVGVEQR